MDFNYEELRKKAMEYFGEDLVRVKTVEECVYTNTKSSDFVIDWVGESSKILICSCCSGHGFKFAPIIGEIISQIVTPISEETKNSSTKVKNPAFNKWQHIFRIAYHQGVNLS
jgi:glycine/D-amino acid oxidase-like deaminating enzyme